MDTETRALCQRIVANLRQQTGLDMELAENGAVRLRRPMGDGWLVNDFFPWKAAQPGPETPPLPAGQPRPAVLVADEITPDQAARLRAGNLAYLDAQGNAWLDAPPLFILIRKPQKPGQPAAAPEKTARKPVKVDRAFGEAGLRLLITLLGEPGLEQKPLRELAERTGLALGTVHNVLAALKELKYLRKRGKANTLVEKRDLLERVAAAYPLALRPQLALGRFRALAQTPDGWKTWWKTAPLNELGACWGGEPGGDLFTGFIAPENFTLYVYGDPAALIRELRLIPDPTGNVELLKAFWPRPGQQPEPAAAPPLVVYADLLATRDERNREVARRLYDDHLLQLVG